MNRAERRRAGFLAERDQLDAGLLATWDPDAVPSVFLCWPDPGRHEGNLTESLLSMLKHDRFAREAILDKGDFRRFVSTPRLSETRNLMVRTCLDLGCTWFLTIDSDMAFRYDALSRLFEVAHPTKAPIVGGLCFGGATDGAELYPTMYVMHDAGDGGVRPDILWEWERGAPVQVDATGAAFLLVHNSVFRFMLAQSPAEPYPWFAETFLGTHKIGEDITFCLRARHRGFPVTVHTGVEVGHVKAHAFGLADYDAARVRVDS